MTNAFSYKIEIELDDEKIIAEKKYDIKSIYSAIRDLFAREKIKEIKSHVPNMLTFASNKKDSKELGRFGAVESALLVKDQRLLPYISKVTWYDTLYNKVNTEDVLEVFMKNGLI